MMARLQASVEFMMKRYALFTGVAALDQELSSVIWIVFENQLKSLSIGCLAPVFKAPGAYQVRHEFP